MFIYIWCKHPCAITIVVLNRKRPKKSAPKPGRKKSKKADPTPTGGNTPRTRVAVAREEAARAAREAEEAAAKAFAAAEVATNAETAAKVAAPDMDVEPIEVEPTERRDGGLEGGE